MDRNRRLTDAERRRLVHIPEERDDLVRLYFFEATDPALIEARRDMPTVSVSRSNSLCCAIPSQKGRAKQYLALLNEVGSIELD